MPICFDLDGTLGTFSSGYLLLREALGEHVFNSFIENKKKEWDSYRTQVSEYELKKYLPIM